MVVENISESIWDEKITSTNLAVVDFWADWCGFCKQLAPIYDEVSENFPDILFAKVDVGVEMNLAQKFGIQGIPAIKFFCFGKEVGSVTGFRTKTQLLQDIVKVQSEAEACAANSSNLKK